MPKHHSTQHREQTEEKKKNKLLAETKRENHQLKRQISRLQKTIQKILDQTGVEHEETKGIGPFFETLACPDCQQPNLTTIQLPFGNMIVCKGCGYRSKK